MANNETTGVHWNPEFMGGNEMLIRSNVGGSDGDGVAATGVAFLERLESCTKAGVLYKDRGRHENGEFSPEARK